MTALTLCQHRLVHSLEENIKKQEMEKAKILFSKHVTVEAFQWVISSNISALFLNSVSF